MSRRNKQTKALDTTDLTNDTPTRARLLAAYHAGKIVNELRWNLEHEALGFRLPGTGHTEVLGRLEVCCVELLPVPIADKFKLTCAKAASDWTGELSSEWFAEEVIEARKKFLRQSPDDLAFDKMVTTTLQRLHALRQKLFRLLSPELSEAFRLGETLGLFQHPYVQPCSSCKPSAEKKSPEKPKRSRTPPKRQFGVKPVARVEAVTLDLQVVPLPANWEQLVEALAAQFDFNIDRLNELQDGEHKCRAKPAFEETENGIERGLAEWVDRRGEVVSDNSNQRKNGKSQGRPLDDKVTERNYMIVMTVESDPKASLKEMADNLKVSIDTVKYALRDPAEWKQRKDDLDQKKSAQTIGKK